MADYSILGMDPEDWARGRRTANDLLRTIGGGMAAQAGAGLLGIGALARGRGLDEAADTARQAQEDLAPTPQDEGSQAILGSLGEYAGAFGNRLSELPGAGLAKRGWEKFTEISPAAGAATLAAANVFGGLPKGIEGAALSATERAAAEAAAKQAALRGGALSLQDLGALTASQREAARKAALDTRVRKRESALVNLQLRSKSPEEALDMVRAGKHIVPKEEGGFVGAPRNIRNLDDLEANRARMDAEYEQAAADLKDAGVVVGDWYPGQRRGVAETADPWQQSRIGRGHGLMSSQASPETEMVFLEQAHNRAMRGEPPGLAKTGRQSEEYAAAVKEGRDIRLAEKTEPYGAQSDPTDVAHPLFGANDFRHARGHGYTEISGDPQESGMSSTEHAWMDAETALMVDRARARAGQTGAPGYPKDIFAPPTEITGSLVQEVPWIRQKAADLQKFFPERFPPSIEGRRAAIHEAAKTAEDYTLKHAISANYEQVPGSGLGHRPDILAASPEEQRAYGEKGASWMSPTGRDVIHESMGFMQRPTEQGFGIWEGKTTPNYIAQPLGDMVTGSPELAQGMKNWMNFAENFRAVGDVQHSGAYHLPMTQATRSGKTHLLMEGPSLGEQEMKDLAAQLPPGWTPTNTPRGTMLMNFTEGSRKRMSQQALLQEQMKSRRNLAAQLGPSVQEAGMEGGLAGGYDYRTPGGGVVTRELLEKGARLPAEWTRNLSESEGVRQALAAKHLRDARAEALEGAQVSEPAQKTRRFFAEADWGKVLDMIRNGMSPEQAVGATGHHLREMGRANVPLVATLAAGLGLGGYGYAKIAGKAKELKAAKDEREREVAKEFARQYKQPTEEDEELKRKAYEGQTAFDKRIDAAGG